MARGYGRILTSIWEDEDFLALDEQHQRMYLFLASQPNLSNGGIVPIAFRRWAASARGLSESELWSQVDLLESRGLVVPDHAEDELYVCGYFRHAGIGNQPRAVAGAYDAITRAASFLLRAVASTELSEAVNGAPAVRGPRGLRAEVLRRDGWQCRGCGWSPGDPVPLTPTGRPLYRGLEVDHIYPQSLGGEDALDNFQVLCTTCNTRKGARV